MESIFQNEREGKLLKKNKSSLRVGINGFGRIGRMIFRQGFDSLNITTVNGTSSAQAMAHLLKYDSIHGVWDKKVTAQEGKLIVEGSSVSCLNGKDPKSTEWDVDIVIECSGRFKSPSDWQSLFSKGLKKVIVSAPAKSADFTLIYGVNHNLYQKDNHRFISNASCTSNCLAPLIKVLKDFCGVKRVLFSTVHSYTNDQRLLDSSHKKDLRRARSAGLNIIPTNTGASSALAMIFPELKDCVQGMAFRVPTSNVSLLDLTVETKKETSLKDIHRALKTAVSADLKGILALEDKPLVSSDFIGRRESSIVDWSLSHIQDGKFLKLVSWYDNESGFSERIIDFIHYMGKR